MLFKVSFDSASIVGLIIWMVCVLYSSLRSASNVAGISNSDTQGNFVEHNILLI